MTCSNRLNTSGCASISSSSNTECGCLLTSSVNSPPGRIPRSRAVRQSTGKPYVAPCTQTCRSESVQGRAHWRAAGDLGLANAGGTGKQETANRFWSVPRPDDSSESRPPVSIASSWPNTTICRSRCRFFNASVSLADTLRGGMRAIFATMFSTSLTETLCAASTRSTTGWPHRLVDHIDRLVRRGGR